MLNTEKCPECKSDAIMESKDSKFAMCQDCKHYWHIEAAPTSLIGVMMFLRMVLLL